MLAHVGLAEEDAALGVEPGGEQDRGRVVDVGPQRRRVPGNGDRVQVDDAVDRRVALVLHVHVLADRADVVAEVLAPGGLDAAEDLHRGAYRNRLRPRPARGLLARGPVPVVAVPGGAGALAGGRRPRRDLRLGSLRVLDPEARDQPRRRSSAPPLTTIADVEGRLRAIGRRGVHLLRPPRPPGRRCRVRTSGLFLASSTTRRRPPGERFAPATSASTVEPNWPAISAPSTAIPSRPGHPRDAVVDPRGDPGVALLDRVERRRGQRRHRDREAEAEHEHAGQHLGQVVGVGGDAGQQQQPDTADDRAHAHRHPRPGAGRHPAEPGREEEQQQGRRRGREPRRERRCSRPSAAGTG